MQRMLTEYFKQSGSTNYPSGSYEGTLPYAVLDILSKTNYASNAYYTTEAAHEKRTKTVVPSCHGSMHGWLNTVR